MAVIGQIRKRSGLLIIIIGVALAAFVLGDFLKPGSGRRSNDVGVVAGENITYPDFAQRAEEQMEILRQNQQKERLTQDEIFQTRQQTWNQMVSEIIMGKEYEKLGLAVSSEELFDQVQGPEPHAYILQYFRDPETNQYNPQLVMNYLRNLEQMEQENRDQWLMLEHAIKQDRHTAKYRNLLSKAYYVPSAFAKMDYELRNSTARARVLGLRYNAIPDDQVSLSEDDYASFYEKNKHQYEQEESRDIDYVIFQVVPSEDDISKAEEDIAQIYPEFTTVEDVTEYMNANSDERYDSSYKMQGELPLRLDTVLFNAEPGAVIGPYFENDRYQIARLVEKTMRPDSMRASHILVAFQGAFQAGQDVTRNRDEAEALADSLKGVVEANPNMFEFIAREWSNDGSVTENGGDLDWFADQAMVKQFNDAVLEGEVGDVTVAETPFGFHVIRITGKKDPVQKIRVAILQRYLEPSSKTYQDIYTQASMFAGSNTTSEAFDAAVAEQGLSPRSARDIKKMDNRIPGIEYPRGIIQWAFLEETEKGAVSTVFDVEDSYVVATVKDVKEEGTASLEQVRSRIEPLVIREKKAEMLKERFAAASGDIYQMAAALEAKVDTLQNVSFNSANLPGFGPEPKLIGDMFSTEVGVVSAPVQGTTAVFVYIVDEVIAAPEKEDYSQDSQQLIRVFENKVNQQYFTVLQDLNDIEDNRFLYF